MFTDLAPAIQTGTRIVVTRSSAAYVADMEAVQRAAYDVPDGEPLDTMTESQFLHHIDLFPEGQFMALDLRSDRVIGTLSGMLVDFDPANPMLEPWEQTVDYG